MAKKTLIPARLYAARVAGCPSDDRCSYLAGFSGVDTRASRARETDKGYE